MAERGEYIGGEAPMGFRVLDNGKLVEVEVPTRISYRGAVLGSRELGWIQRIVDRLGRDQRREDFAQAVCKSFEWRRSDGRLAVESCRLLLGRLERRGLVRLPKSRRIGGSSHAGKWLGDLAPEPGAMASIEQLSGALVVRPISESERLWWRACMDRYHYLGNCRMVGESLRYVAVVGTEPVALLGWAAAALHNKRRLAGLRPIPTSGRRATSPCGAPSLQTSDDRRQSQNLNTMLNET
jgi:hypothetical protein